MCVHEYTCFLSLLQCLLSLLPPLGSLGQLPTLHSRWLAIKHIHRLDSVLHHADCTIEEPHQMAVNGLGEVRIKLEGERIRDKLGG